MKKVIDVQVSCDNTFIERVSKWDPFNYWNKYIAPTTHQKIFLQDSCPEDVKITISETNLFDYNFKIRYEYDLNTSLGPHDVLHEALIIYHGIQLVSFKENAL